MKLLNFFQLVKSVNSTKTTEQREVELLNEVKTLSKYLLERMKKHEPKENLNDFKEEIKLKSKEHLENFKKASAIGTSNVVGQNRMFKNFLKFYDEQTKLVYEMSEELKIPIDINKYDVLSKIEDCINGMKRRIDSYCEFLENKENFKIYDKGEETFKSAYGFLTYLSGKIKTNKGERIKSLETATPVHGRLGRTKRLLKEFKKEKLVGKEDVEKLEKILQETKKLDIVYLNFHSGPLIVLRHSDTIKYDFEEVQNDLISTAGCYFGIKPNLEAKLTTILKADTSCLNTHDFLDNLNSISRLLGTHKEAFGELGQELRKAIDEINVLPKDKTPF